MSTCPTCGSPHPKQHPATMHEGEVLQLCRDPWHHPTAEQIEFASQPVEHHAPSPWVRVDAAEARITELTAELAKCQAAWTGMDELWKVEMRKRIEGEERIAELEATLTAIIAEVQDDGSLMKCGMIADAALAPKAGP